MFPKHIQTSLGEIVRNGKSINIIQTNCDKTAAQDKSLPRNAYLVVYSEDGEEKFDIVCGLQVDIFDHYHDQNKQVRSYRMDGRDDQPEVLGLPSKGFGKEKK